MILANNERKTGAVAIAIVIPSAVFSLCLHSVPFDTIEVLAGKGVCSGDNVVIPVEKVADIFLHSSGRNISYIGPITIRHAADPKRITDNSHPNAMFKAVPENQAAQYVITASDKFSPASPKINLPKYIVILQFKNAPTAVSA